MSILILQVIEGRIAVTSISCRFLSLFIHPLQNERRVIGAQSLSIILPVDSEVVVRISLSGIS